MADHMSTGVWQGIRRWWSDVLGTKVYFRYLEKEDRKRRLAGQFSTFITIILGCYYILWHFKAINWGFWYFSPVFFLAELIGLLLFSFFAIDAWFLRYHSPEGMPVETPFSVDVFITVAGEPIELLRETLEATTRIDHHLKKIFILDDKGDLAYQRLAERYGCGYFAREDHRDAKAGNLNYAFQRTSGDLILTLDADQVPHAEIIQKLIGFFKIPLIAFVQTKQDFKVPEGDPFGNTDRIFYNVMQSGKDTDNAAFSCGSGVIYRRKALEEIGGFSTWNLVEDVHTSMLLHEHGWRSIYYNYSLSKGTAPADIYGVYRQRRQWAADSLRILFWDSPFGRKGLSLKQKLQYFHLGFVYLVAAFIMPIFFITPIIALLSRKFVLTAPVDSYVLHRFPYFIAMSIAYGILNFPTPYMKAFQMWTGLFPSFIWATWIALRSRKKKPLYKVNPKPIGVMKSKNPLMAIFPQMGIILLSIFSVVYVFITGGISWDFYLLNLVWSLWSIWTMSGICGAAIKKHQWSEKEEIEESKYFPLFSKAKELVFTVSISLLITVFFLFADMAQVEQFLNGARAKIISLTGYTDEGKFISLQEITKPPQALEPVKRVEEPSETKATGTPPVEEKTELAKIEEKPKEMVSIKKEWVIQIFSSKSRDNAMRYCDELTSKGFRAYHTTTKVGEEDWYRVRVGFFESEEEANKVSEGIGKNFSIQTPLWITKASKEELESHGK
jgi:cellulose synthase (UDP-forming)